MDDSPKKLNELPDHVQDDIRAAAKRQGFNSVEEFFSWERPQVTKTYTAVVERCNETNLFVGFVPGFAGAHAQAKTLEELNQNLQEVIAALLTDGEPELNEFVGVLNIPVTI